MANIGKVMADLKPAFLMILVQVAYAGVSISYKLVANDGMSLSILIAYRFLFASALLVPLAFFVERKSKPKITGGVLFQAFLCGLFGASLSENLFVEAVDLASATYASAMCNLIPGATFILAVCFGLERLNIGRATGITKVVGTVMGIGGAMILTFYKSTEIHIWSTHLNLMKHVAPHKVSANQIWGSALAFGTCLSYSLWLIIQTRISEKFPWHYTSAALMSVMASIQSVIFALFMERDWNQWKLGWNLRLLTAAYSGIAASGLVWVLITWCVRLKGPLYASIFKPLFLVVVAIVGSLILDERLHLGSIIGCLLIVLGLYTVLWGKGKELKEIADPNLANGSLEGDSLKIITTNHQEDDRTTNNDDIMSPGFTATLSSFFISNDLSIKQKVSRKETEANEKEDIPNDPS